jgi:hypothetical protein
MAGTVTTPSPLRRRIDGDRHPQVADWSGYPAAGDGSR